MKNNFPKLQMYTPAARFITGDLTVKRATDADGRPVPPDEQDYQFGIAIAKDNPDFQRFWGEVFNYAMSYYGTDPEVSARMQRGFISSKGPQGGFSWKIKDGDMPNSKGVINENAKGHWIVYMSTSYPVTAANAQNVSIDPKTIKRGNIIDVAGSFAINGERGDRAGVYINPSIVRFLAFHPDGEITGGLSAEQAFGGRPLPQLPAGASQTPPATAFPQAQPQPAGFPPAAGPGQMQAPQYAQPTQPQYAAPPSAPYAQPGGVPPAAYPSTTQAPPYQTPAAGPAAYPAPGQPSFAPNAAYPSSAGPFPPAAGGVPPVAQQPAFAPGAPPASMMPASTYPIDPRTGQPIQPQPQFLQPGQPQQYPPR